jgi:hypothetical protein
VRTRTLARRVVKARATPTKLALEQMASAAEPAEETWREDTPPNPDDRAALHRYLDRAAARYRAMFPPDHEPLARSLESWAAGARGEYHGRRDHEAHLRAELAEVIGGQVDQVDEQERPEPQRRH